MATAVFRPAGVFLVLAAAFAASPAPASAQRLCAPRAELAALLASCFAEAPHAQGRIGAGVLMELYLSAAGSWTITVTDAEGRACVVAGGERFAPSPSGKERSS